MRTTLYFLYDGGREREERELSNDKVYSKEEIDEILRKFNYLKEEVERLRLQKKVEYREGLYRQTIITHGKKKRTRLTRLEKNHEKMTLGWLGMIEVHCYPYQSFEKMFWRLGNEIYGVDKFDLPKLLRIYQRSKWFTKHGKKVVSGKLKSKSPIAQELINAYNAGVKKTFSKLNKKKEKEK